jgi:hypothetical protein
MESTYRVPIPKTPIHQTSRDDQLRVQILFYTAGWNVDDIVPRLNLSRCQVHYALEHQPTSQKHHRGRHLLLDTPRPKILTDWVTANAGNQ